MAQKSGKASIGLLGDRSSGKSVAMSLLWLTARNKSIQAPDKFIVDVDPRSLQIFQDNAGSLERKRFPSATMKGALSQVQLKFRFSTIPNIKIPSILRSKKHFPSKFLWKNVTMTINDIAGEDIKDTLVSAAKIQDTRGLMESIGDNDQIKQLLNNQAFIIMLDGEKLTNNDSCVALDYEVATIISALQNYRKLINKRSFNGLVFIISKWDVFAKNLGDSIDSDDVKELVKPLIPTTVNAINTLERDNIMKADTIPWLPSRLDVLRDDNGDEMLTPITNTDGTPRLLPDGEEDKGPEIKTPLTEHYSVDTYEEVLGWIQSLETSFLDAFRSPR